jgi:hypothetical protein
MSKHRKQRRRCLLIQEKKGLGGQKDIGTHLCQGKSENGLEKRLANPGRRRIIMKTAKNSSFTP